MKKKVIALLSSILILASAICTVYVTPVPIYALGEEIVFEQLVDMFLASMGFATGSSSANSDAWGKVCDKLADNIINDVSTNTPYAYIKNYFNFGTQSVTTLKNFVITHPQEITHELWNNMTKAITDSWNSVYGTAESIIMKSYSGDTSPYFTSGNYANLTVGVDGSLYCDTENITSTGRISCFNSGSQYTLISLSNIVGTYVSYRWINNAWSKISWGSLYTQTNIYSGYYAVPLNGYSGGKVKDISITYPVFDSLTIAEQYLVDGDDSAAKAGTNVISWPLAIPAAIPSILDGAKINSIPATLASDIAGAIAVDYPAGAIATDIPAEQTDKAKKDIAGVLAPALDIPSTWTDTNGAYEFDLRDFFPFCIPFDLINCIKGLKADRQAPSFNIPVNMNLTHGGKTYLDYQHTFVLDFSQFDTLAEIFRMCELALFIFSLILITRELIRG